MVYVMNCKLNLCNYVLEVIYGFKLVLKCLKLKFKVGIYVFSKQVFVNLSLNDFSCIFIFK